MAVNVYPLDPAAGAPSYAAQAVRQALAALVGPFPAGRPLGAVSGVRPGTPATTVTVSGLNVTVHPHAGIIDAETAAAAGPYLYAIDADVTKTLGAASGSNDRKDLISVKVSDPTQDASSVPGGDIVITQGTPAGTPTVPATPAGCMPLAVANVPKSGTGSPSITWAPTYSAAAGGILPVSGAAQYPANPYVGQCIDDAATGRQMRWNGTAWKMTNASAQLATTATITLLSGQNAGVNTAVPYGSTFPTTPIVMATIAANTFAAVTVYNETTSQCAVRVFRPDGSNAGVTSNIPVRLLIIDPAAWTG